MPEGSEESLVFLKPVTKVDLDPEVMKLIPPSDINRVVHIDAERADVREKRLKDLAFQAIVQSIEE